MPREPDFAVAHEIQRLEAEMDRERTRLNLATLRGAWAEAKTHAGNLASLEAQLSAVRSKPLQAHDGHRIRVEG